MVAFLTVIADQITKYLIFSFQPNLNLGILTIHLVKNTGAGFGILQGQNFWLALISVVVVIVLIFNYKRIPEKKTGQILFALLLGGIVGNLIDRIVRGYVIDFIDFQFWPAFNVADMAITISVIGLMVYYWKK